MKYALPIFAFSALFATTSCSEAPKESAPAATTTAPAEAPQEEKGTSVEIGEGGVKVESKDVDVKLTTDTAGVKVTLP